jgi:hypothetical protein
MKNYCLAIIISLLFVCLAHADEEVMNKTILEKHIDISSSRKCDPSKEDAEYKCICYLSVHYPIFTKQSIGKGMLLVNDVIDKFITDLRRKMSQCQVGGVDFGKNTIIYNILYDDSKYLSLAFEKYFCCNENGTKPELFVFNFEDVDNISKLRDLTDKALDPVIGKPEAFQNNLLQVYKTDVGQSAIKLRNSIYYYFTKDGISLKIWPDKSSFQTIDVPLPKELVKPRVYPQQMPIDDYSNDSINEYTTPQNNGDTEE